MNAPLTNEQFHRLAGFACALLDFGSNFQSIDAAIAVNQHARRPLACAEFPGEFRQFVHKRRLASERIVDCQLLRSADPLGDNRMPPVVLIETENCSASTINA
jgi:hypothetical protein